MNESEDESEGRIMGKAIQTTWAGAPVWRSLEAGVAKLNGGRYMSELQCSGRTTRMDV